MMRILDPTLRHEATTSAPVRESDADLLAGGFVVVITAIGD